MVCVRHMCYYYLEPHARAAALCVLSCCCCYYPVGSSLSFTSASTASCTFRATVSPLQLVS